MEFWGIEVISGKPTDVKLGDHSYLHVSQAALGESKGGKGSAERVVLRAYVEKQEVVIGTLAPGKCDQIALDLIFNKGFKLSHNSTSYNVYFCGYSSESPGEEFLSSDEEEEDVKDEEPSGVPILPKANGKRGTGAKDVKSDVSGSVVATETPNEPALKIQAGTGKPVKDSKVNTTTSTVAAAAQGPKKVGFKDSAAGNPPKEETKKMNVKAQDVKGDKEKSIIVLDESDDEDDKNESNDEEEEEDDDEEEDDSDEDMDDVDDKLDLLADSDSEDDEEDKEDIPKLKKRAKSSTGAIKTPQSGKKQKLSKHVEGVKPGVISVPGKKLGDQKTVTTPASKQQQTPVQSAKKTPGKQSPSSNIKKTDQEKSPPGAKQTPSKPGQYKCATCSRDFSTESALSQHASAKHKT